jgi:hypothetical protein
VSGALVVADGAETLHFTFADMLRYHGPGSPGGVAHAYKVLERALPVLGEHGRVQRRAIGVRTAFGGPGARDGFELVTRAVTEGRYAVDAELARPERGVALERFVFCVGAAERVVRLELREGFVSDEFVLLARAEVRSAGDERRLTAMQRVMAKAVMAARASDVYDLVQRER